MKRISSTRVLRLVAVIAPMAFWLLVLYLRTVLFAEQRSTEGDLFALIILGLGAALFSNWVFGIMEVREKEVELRTDQLSALHSAALALTTELELATVLQKVTDLARRLAHAHYGALAVLDDQGEHIAQFITSGLSPEQRAQMPVPPRGHGLLGALITEGKPIRIPSIEQDPRSIGFPPNHPAMTAFLGVPIRSKKKVVGNLYLTDKLGEGDSFSIFTELDQQVLEMFATQAAIAIENAQLYRQTQQLSVLKERERFGMDLHDGIIQSVYAVGLILEDCLHIIANEPKEAQLRIEHAIKDLNDVIRDIRSYIMNLSPQHFQGRDLKRGLEELARGLRANTYLNVTLHMDSIDLSSLTSEQTVEILHVAQEALTNVRKHARAGNVEVSLQRDDENLFLRVRDDGTGLDKEDGEKSSGYGLDNMRERASTLHGEIRIEANETHGMSVILRVPLVE